VHRHGAVQGVEQEVFDVPRPCIPPALACGIACPGVVRWVRSDHVDDARISVIVPTIAAVTTRTGLGVHAELDTPKYRQA